MGADITLLQAMGVVEDPAPAQIVRPLDDHYRSPPECVRALASVEDLTGGVHECCAGDGTMAAAAADVLGRDSVYASTLYPSPRTYFPVHVGVDFLQLGELQRRHLVTNPPFSRLYGRTLAKAGAATRIIAHALQLLEAAGDQAGLLCCLLDLRFRLGERRNAPGGLLHEYPPAVIHAFADRVTMYPPDVGSEPLNGGTLPFGWFVWRPPYRRPGATTELRVDLVSRAFRQPDDSTRFGLPVIRSRKPRAAGAGDQP